jgi:hypothetical protein
MSAAALLLVWLAAGSQMLLDEVFHVPAGEWRYVPVILKQPPVTVDCDFRVISGNGAVRVVLVNRDVAKHPDLNCTFLRQHGSDCTGAASRRPRVITKNTSQLSRLVLL